MQLQMPVWREVRALGAIFLVAIGVALATTLVSSAFTRVRQVDAEDVNTVETPAAAAPAGQQVLVIAPWGVKLTLPLAPESTLLSYANQGGASVGLTSADLEKLGPTCLAAHSALGNLVRYPRGHYAAYPHSGTPIEYFVGTVGDYDYGYRLPAGLCSSAATAGSIINRETSVINANLSSLAPAQP